MRALAQSTVCCLKLTAMPLPLTPSLEIVWSTLENRLRLDSFGAMGLSLWWGNGLLQLVASLQKLPLRLLYHLNLKQPPPLIHPLPQLPLAIIWIPSPPLHQRTVKILTHFAQKAIHWLMVATFASHWSMGRMTNGWTIMMQKGFVQRMEQHLPNLTPKRNWYVNETRLNYHSDQYKTSIRKLLFFTGGNSQYLNSTI